MTRSRSAPTPVVAPYSACPRSSNLAIASRAAWLRARASGASATGSPRRATASTAAGGGGAPSSTIGSAISIASRGCQRDRNRLASHGAAHPGAVVRARARGDRLGAVRLGDRHHAVSPDRAGGRSVAAPAVRDPHPDPALAPARERAHVAGAGDRLPVRARARQHELQLLLGHPPDPARGRGHPRVRRAAVPRAGRLAPGVGSRVGGGGGGAGAAPPPRAG